MRVLLLTQPTVPFVLRAARRTRVHARRGQAPSTTLRPQTSGLPITLHLAHVDGTRFVLASAADSALAKTDAVTAVRRGGDIVTLHLATGRTVSLLVSPGLTLSFSTEENPELVPTSPSWPGLPTWDEGDFLI